RPGLQPGAVPGRAHGAPLAERALARDPPPAGRRDLRGHGGVRGGDRRLVLGDGELPRVVPASVPEGDRARVRREPTPGCRLLLGGRRAASPALAGRAAPWAR